MRIDAINNYLYTSQARPIQPNADQQLLAWANEKIQSGDISLDDSRAFMAMTIKIPVNGGSAAAFQAVHSTDRVDFMQKVRDGINGALERNDKETLKMLGAALAIMQQYQGQTISIDSRI